MSPKAAPGAAGLALIDDAWRDVDDSQLPGVLLAFPFYENVDMDELLGPLIARGIKVFADSGAFSAWRSGNSIDLDRYTAWLKKWSHLFNQYANLDVIGDAAGTAVNQAALEAEGLHPLPTLHYGVSWERFDEVIDYINAHDRPLALYHFGHDRTETERLLGNTVAGGVCIHETLLQYACSNIPFGGVGASGMGHYHGRDGFITFSKEMPVLRQARWTLSDKLKPPYRGFPAKVIRLLLR